MRRKLAAAAGLAIFAALMAVASVCAAVGLLVWLAGGARTGPEDGVDGIRGGG